MRHRLIVVFLILAVVILSPGSTAQRKVPPLDVRELMTTQEFRGAGLYKLTSNEIEALNQWLSRFAIQFGKSSRKSVDVDDDSSFAHYSVDLGLVSDFEDLRELVDGCLDLGTLERVRRQLESVTDLESMRSTLERLGTAEFRNCPKGVRGSGIRRR